MLGTSFLSEEMIDFSFIAGGWFISVVCLVLALSGDFLFGYRVVSFDLFVPKCKLMLFWNVCLWILFYVYFCLLLFVLKWIYWVSFWCYRMILFSTRVMTFWMYVLLFWLFPCLSILYYMFRSVLHRELLYITCWGALLAPMNNCLVILIEWLLLVTINIFLIDKLCAIIVELSSWARILYVECSLPFLPYRIPSSTKSM